MVEPCGFNAMNKLARLSNGWDEVVPAARDVRVRINAQDARGDGVAVMVIVKEPAVDLRGAKSGLNCFQLHGKRIRHLGAGQGDARSLYGPPQVSADGGHKKIIFLWRLECNFALLPVSATCGPPFGGIPFRFVWNLACCSFKDQMGGKMPCKLD